MCAYKLKSQLIVGSIALFCMSCQTEKNIAKPEPLIKDETQTTVTEEVVTPIVYEVPAPALPVEQPQVVQPEPQKVEKPAEPANDEYTRSTGDIQISQDTFENDKRSVLEIIGNLNDIMKERNYNEWLKYVDQSSVNYWSQKPNLKKAEKKLPIKGIQLKTLKDYFIYVFIPARAGRDVSEIRYISDTAIKAVQVDEQQDIVYYYFNKSKDTWKLYIPPLEN